MTAGARGVGYPRGVALERNLLLCGRCWTGGPVASTYRVTKGTHTPPTHVKHDTRDTRNLVTPMHSPLPSDTAAIAWTPSGVAR